MPHLLEQNINYNRKSVSKILDYFMEDTMKRVLENIQIQQIGQYNPNARWQGVGDLERSIHATITKNANGDQALVTFFYRNYGRYVEIAVQKNLKYMPLDEMDSKQPIQRPDGARRLAKPFLHSQIRRQINRALSELGKLYIYHGAAAMWQGVAVENDPTLAAMNNKSLQDLASALNI